NAVLYLSQPGLTIDWVEEVVRVVLEFGSPQLARQLVMSAGLEFGTRSGMTVMMQVLLRSDLEDALNYQRQQRQKALDRLKAKRERVAAAAKTTTTAMEDSEEGIAEDDGKAAEGGGEEDEDDDGFVLDPKFYEELFGQLLSYCFEGSDKKPNKTAIQDLSRQTLSRYEEQALVRYGASHPAHSSTRTVCWEFLAMYYVKHSCFLEAIGIHQRLLEDEELGGGSGSGSGSGSGDQSKAKREQRQEIIRQLKEMLPEPQIKLLEVQEDERRRRRGSDKAEEKKDSMEVEEDDNVEGQSPAAQKQQHDRDHGRQILTNTDGYRKGTMKGLLEGWVELQRDLEKLAQTKAKAKVSSTTTTAAAARSSLTMEKDVQDKDGENVAVVPRKPFQSLWQMDADRYLRAWQSDLLSTKESL
ncbi:hypothetical protein BGZ73_007495, partial [Actinomortierella ambigua]